MNGDRGGRPACPRTSGLIDRIVAGSAGDDDRRHAATCPACGPIMARAARFDDELGRSAQRLIAEDMPRGILDPTLREVKVIPLLRLAPGAMAGLAALAVIVIASVMQVRPNLSPGESPTQPPLVVQVPGSTPLRSLTDLTGALAETLDYECAAAGPPTPGVVAATSAGCTGASKTGEFTVSVVLDAAETGSVVHVTIRAEVDEAVPPQEVDEARTWVASALAKVTATAFAEYGPSARAANFVFAQASQMAGPAWPIGMNEGDVHVDITRLANGGFKVQLAVGA